MKLSERIYSLLKDNRGNVQMAFGLASMAIALYMTTIIVGTLGTSMTGSLSTSTVALAGFNNVTKYVFLALQIGSLGMLVYAAMAMFGWFGIGSGGGRASRR